ncbi:MAG: polyphenol oxidase family protein, partial [candidate division WOR-3 bacterium]
MWQKVNDSLFVFNGKETVAVMTTKKGRSVFKKVQQQREVYFLNQIHSDRVVDIDCERTTVGDGLVTSRRDIFIGLKVADCLPIYFIAKDRIGIVHAGWKGTLNKIALKMLDKFDKKPVYFFGACIGPCCYSIDKDRYDLFKKDFPEEIF